jgi:mycothiol system anti-sigma-R factor
MDCREVLDTVYFYLDNECDGGQRVRIMHHLEECGPCLRQFGIEAEVKALVTRSCGHQAAPDTLKLRVMERIRDIRVDG